MSSLLYTTTFIATLGSGLVAGIFFAFSTFIMKALGKLPPEKGIAAMQSINVVIINPWFIPLFIGTALLCVLITVLTFVQRPPSAMTWLLIGSVLYFAGSFVFTMMFNVPRNNALDAVDPSSAEGAKLWADYLVTWTFWNHVRTVASLGAMASFIVALNRLSS
ncbi:putative membrane protein [Roseimicrobium gellanilyticum]|uniref:Putative membrane protein n=1 Tax=Roseimicrobium gellanilyticum TaxID=748857 RepID=A0A366HU58_9BACT|nr:anthrone oxygenase family protein [Roseimicrobium gellanilyticum]RBP47812.1 putative membrane protein [Roseimicrobium gellanilyticum]